MKNEQNLTPALLKKAKTAASVAALLAMAEENGVTLTPEQAAMYYAQLHPEAGTVSDEELDHVSGGCVDDTIERPSKDNTSRV